MWRMPLACRDGSQASPLPGLGGLARQTPSFSNDDIRHRSATLTPTCSCSLGVTAMLKLGDKSGLLELTHGAQDLTHHFGGR